MRGSSATEAYLQCSSGCEFNCRTGKGSEREGVLNVRSVWRACEGQRQENSLTYKGAAEKSQRVAACNAANYKMVAATPTSTSTSTQAA